MMDAEGTERCFVARTGDWCAIWIWLPAVAYPDVQWCRRTLFCKDEFPYAVALFRKVVHLPFVPVNVTAWISADTRYRCRINGSVISRGPAEAGGDYGNQESPDWWFYDGLEANGLMRQGRNVITADVVLGPRVQADYSMGRGGFLLELLVQGRDGESLVIGTDETWRTTRCEASVSPGLHDARREPAGWQDSTYDDGGWHRAEELGPPADQPWNLMPREIPALAETRIAPAEIVIPGESRGEHRFRCTPVGITVTPGAPVGFRLRFPQELTGYLHLEVTGACGTRINAGFRELPDAKDNSIESFILPGGFWMHETRRLQGFEWLDVTVSFPDEAAEPLEIHALDAVFTSFPVVYRGHFECPDEFLNRLWAVGRWTTRLCMQSYHLDSPIHQEGLGCTGDYMIEALISYCCFGESRLARKDILRTALLLKQKHGRMFHTSYSLLWVWMVMDYVHFSDDRDTVRAVMPAIHSLMNRFASYIGPTGLITEAPDYLFMDWVPVGDFNLHHPPASMGQGYMNAFYYRALQSAAALSALVGEEGHAGGYRRSAETVKDAFNAHLWVAGKGLYRDGLPGITAIAPHDWLPPDPPADSYTLHTNAAAVAVGIASPGTRQALMQNVMEDASLPVVQPYYMHIVFEALEKAGLFDTYAFTAMKRWQPLLEEHPSSLKEAWDWGDYSHAWGGTSTWQLSTRVLGVEVRTPGWERFSLSPHLGPLSWAGGTVPTPRGPVKVSWRKTGNHLSGILEGPEGCTVSLCINDAVPGGIAVCREDGMQPTLSKDSAGGVCWRLTAGTYRIQVETGTGAGA